SLRCAGLHCHLHSFPTRRSSDLATRSPARTPSAVSAFAAWHTCRSRSEYVMVRVSPGSPSQWKATRSPSPAATWRSRQLYATLRSEEHTSELQSRENLVCRRLLE